MFSLVCEKTETWLSAVKEKRKKRKGYESEGSATKGVVVWDKNARFLYFAALMCYARRHVSRTPKRVSRCGRRKCAIGVLVCSTSFCHVAALGAHRQKLMSFWLSPPPDAATIWRGSDAGDRTTEYGNVEDTTAFFVLRSTGHPAGFRSGSCTCASFWPKNLGLGEIVLLCRQRTLYDRLEVLLAYQPRQPKL